MRTRTEVTKMLAAAYGGAQPDPTKMTDPSTWDPTNRQRFERQADLVLELIEAEAVRIEQGNL